LLVKINYKEDCTDATSDDTTKEVDHRWVIVILEARIGVFVRLAHSVKELIKSLGGLDVLLTNLLDNLS
jgi:hypothetical protein